MKQLGIKLGDVILMVLLLVTAICLLLLPRLKETAATAEIVMAETGQVKTVSLNIDADYEILSRGISLLISVRDGEISVAHADCPDGICTNTPPISRPGQSIVCAPAGVVVRITGEGAIVDGVSG